VSAQYRIFNGLYDATTGLMAAGTSYASGAKVAIQVATSSTNRMRIIEVGAVGFGTAGGTKYGLSLAQAATATTCTTAHSAASVAPTGDDTTAWPGTFSTATTAFGVTAITSTTTDRQYLGIGLDPAEHYEKQWPLGRDMVVAPSKFLQLRINTGATFNVLCWVDVELC
jgi:hypothetical protein